MKSLFTLIALLICTTVHATQISWQIKINNNSQSGYNRFDLKYIEIHGITTSGKDIFLAVSSYYTANSPCGMIVSFNGTTSPLDSNYKNKYGYASFYPFKVPSKTIEINDCQTTKIPQNIKSYYLAMRYRIAGPSEAKAQLFLLIDSTVKSASPILTPEPNTGNTGGTFKEITLE